MRLALRSLSILLALSITSSGASARGHVQTKSPVSRLDLIDETSGAGAVAPVSSKADLRSVRLLGNSTHVKNRSKKKSKAKKGKKQTGKKVKNGKSKTKKKRAPVNSPPAGNENGLPDSAAANAELVEPLGLPLKRQPVEGQARDHANGQANGKVESQAKGQANGKVESQAKGQANGTAEQAKGQAKDQSEEKPSEKFSHLTNQSSPADEPKPKLVPAVAPPEARPRPAAGSTTSAVVGLKSDNAPKLSGGREDHPPKPTSLDVAGNSEAGNSQNGNSETSPLLALRGPDDGSGFVADSHSDLGYLSQFGSDDSLLVIVPVVGALCFVAVCAVVCMVVCQRRKSRATSEHQSPRLRGLESIRTLSTLSDDSDSDLESAEQETAVVVLLGEVLNDLGMSLGKARFSKVLKDNYLTRINQLRSYDRDDWARLELPEKVKRRLRKRLSEDEPEVRRRSDHRRLSSLSRMSDGVSDSVSDECEESGDDSRTFSLLESKKSLKKQPQPVDFELDFELLSDSDSEEEIEVSVKPDTVCSALDDVLETTEKSQTRN